MIGGLARGLFYSLFNPSSFVAARTDTYASERLLKLRLTARLTVIYFLNLLLYAIPLTLAGFGDVGATAAPTAFAGLVAPVVGNPDSAWRFVSSLGQNSAFLTAAAALTLVTFHAGVVITRSSQGFLQTLHTVVYSTSAYLAAIFTAVWYLSTSTAVAVADGLLIYWQAEFVYFFIDALGAPVGLPGGRPSPVDVSQLSTGGTVAIALLVVALLYYLYSLYLGSRINHHTTRFTAGLVVSIVAVSPAIYVVGSILAATTLP